MSTPESCPLPAPSSRATANAAASKPTESRPKPCCVCKEEKAARDECLLFSETGPEKCANHITAYKKCMAGFGFNI